MDGFVNELDKLLDKYGITLYEATKIYEKCQKQVRRLSLCDSSDKGVKTFWVKGEMNPCACGSNCFHYEYDRIDNKIYGVCNACKADIYELKRNYMDEMLHEGLWLSK